MRFILLALLSCLLISTAWAGTPEDPEIADPAGDATIFPTIPAAGPLADLVDITAVWVDGLTNDTVDVSVRSVDFTAIAYNQVDVLADTMFIVDFTLDGVPWDVRADLIVVNGVFSSEDWTFQLRRLDGGPGSEWDDTVDIPGEVDEVLATVTFHVPLNALNRTGPGDLVLTESTAQLHTTARVSLVDFAKGTGRVFRLHDDPASADTVATNESLLAGPEPEAATPWPGVGTVAVLAVAAVATRRRWITFR